MSKRQIKVIVNGTPYEVEVGDLGGDPIQVMVNGKPYEVAFAEGGAQEVSKSATVTTVARSLTPAASPAAQMQESPKPAIPQAPAQVTKPDAQDELHSPMPGTILDINVKVGDKVTRGQQLCSLEAMKMKSAVRSPREGVISCVEVSDGQKVAYGDLLFRFE
jgi:biotin carboxyl carrier protein